MCVPWSVLGLDFLGSIQPGAQGSALMTSSPNVAGARVLCTRRVVCMLWRCPAHTSRGLVVQPGAAFLLVGRCLCQTPLIAFGLCKVLSMLMDACQSDQKPTICRCAGLALSTLAATSQGYSNCNPFQAMHHHKADTSHRQHTGSLLKLCESQHQRHPNSVGTSFIDSSRHSSAPPSAAV